MEDDSSEDKSDSIADHYHDWPHAYDLQNSFEKYPAFLMDHIRFDDSETYKPSETDQ